MERESVNEKKGGAFPLIEEVDRPGLELNLHSTTLSAVFLANLLLDLVDRHALIVHLSRVQRDVLAHISGGGV
jgi:hypothetical protein